MLDAYITAMNTQYASASMLNEISENMMNAYTPGYKEKSFQFKTFLNGAAAETYTDVRKQGKAIPGAADENLYIEGKGYFVLRNKNGKTAYTRLGDFKFDGNGVLKSKDGQAVQGWLVNEKSEIMNGVKAQDASSFIGADFKTSGIPLSDIKLWIDPDNGKYLGRYEEFEIKDDGILYGKADKGKIKTPLYKIAAVNFNNPRGLFEIKSGQYIETEESGNSIISNAQVRGKTLEQSSVDFTLASNLYQKLQFQLSAADMMSKSQRQLLEQVMGLMGQ